MGESAVAVSLSAHRCRRPRSRGKEGLGTISLGYVDRPCRQRKIPPQYRCDGGCCHCLSSIPTFRYSFRLPVRYQKGLEYCYRPSPVFLPVPSRAAFSAMRSSTYICSNLRTPGGISTSRIRTKTWEAKGMPVQPKLS